jgi:hypothetical protein
LIDEQPRVPEEKIYKHSQAERGEGSEKKREPGVPGKCQIASDTSIIIQKQNAVKQKRCYQPFVSSVRE